MAWAVPELGSVRPARCSSSHPSRCPLLAALVLRSLRETSQRPSITIIRVYKSTRKYFSFVVKEMEVCKWRHLRQCIRPALEARACPQGASPSPRGRTGAPAARALGDALPRRLLVFRKFTAGSPVQPGLDPRTHIR